MAQCTMFMFIVQFSAVQWRTMRSDANEAKHKWHKSKHEHGSVCVCVRVHCAPICEQPNEMTATHCFRFSFAHTFVALWFNWQRSYTLLHTHTVAISVASARVMSFMTLRHHHHHQSQTLCCVCSLKLSSNVWLKPILMFHTIQWNVKRPHTHSYAEQWRRFNFVLKNHL